MVDTKRRIEEDMYAPVRSSEVTGVLAAMGILWAVGIKWSIIFFHFSYFRLSEILAFYSVVVTLVLLSVTAWQRARGHILRRELHVATVFFSVTTTWCVTQLHCAMGGWDKSENVIIWWVSSSMYMPLFDVPNRIWTKIMGAFGFIFLCDMVAEIGFAHNLPVGVSWPILKIHHALRGSMGVQTGWPEQVPPTLLYCVKMNNFFTPIAIFIWGLSRETAQRKEWQMKSDAVLNNLIPPDVADKLRKGIKGPKLTKRHTEVTCFFSDLVGYTQICDNQDPARVMSVLDQMYTALDYMTEVTGVYKVETIGDSYFAVANLGVDGQQNSPEESAYRMAVFSLAVKHFIGGRFGQSHRFRVRCGLHTGDLVAGILGNHRPRYVLVGDTVNTASRMESNADPSTVNVSEKSAVYLEKYFSLRDRGELEVKGKGKVRMFELGECKEEYRGGAFGLTLAPEEIAEMANDHLAETWLDENENLSPVWSHSWRSTRRSSGCSITSLSSSESDTGKCKEM